MDTSDAELGMCGLASFRNEVPELEPSKAIELRPSSLISCGGDFANLS